MVEVNPLSTVTAFLLVLVWCLQLSANALPNWSTVDADGMTLRTGLWGSCVTIANLVACGSQVDLVKNSGFRVAAAVLCVMGNTLIFCASFVACGLAATQSRALATCLVITIWLGWIFLMIGWGMWLGVHNNFYKPVGGKLGASFILACIASSFAFLCLCTASAYVAMEKKGKAKGNADPDLHAEDAHYKGEPTSTPFEGEAVVTPEVSYPEPSPTPVHL